MVKQTKNSNSFDWLGCEVFPESWAHIFEPKDFMIPCGESLHVINWTPDGGAVATGHGTNEQVVAALGRPKAMCERVAAVMNTSKLDSIRNDSETFMDLAEFLTSLPDYNEMFLRSVKTFAIKRFVEDAFRLWVSNLDFDMDLNKLDLKITVTPTCSSFSNIHGVDDSFVHPDPIGMRMSVGNSTTPRAVVCVTEDWYENVLSYGVTSNGRFLLGAHEDGAVWSEFGLADNSTSGQLVGCWAKLFNHKPEKQDLETIYEVASTPASSKTNGDLYVGSYTSWDYNDEYYCIEEGEVPVCVLGSYNDAVSWKTMVDFHDTFTGVITFSEYAENVEGVLPEGFDFDIHDERDLLALCVRKGIDPCDYSLPMATISGVKDLRFKS